jgi:hypothetical protein
MHDIGQRYTARLPGLLDRSYKDWQRLHGI